MEREISVKLLQIANLSKRYFEQSTHKQQVESLTGANSWIITYVARREAQGQLVYQRDLEQCFGITRSTASKVVALMVKKGLLEQRTVQRDRRLRRLVLTPQALRVNELINEDVQAFEAALRQGFSPEELDALFGLLSRLKNNLKKEEEKEEPGVD